MPHHIDIEDTTTWPDRFLEIMSENKSLFIAFQAEDLRIDKLARKEVTLRMGRNRPVNAYADEYADAVSALAEILREHNIVGYHCTRLAEYEIASIRRDGMRILTAELIHQRLQSALDAGLLSEDRHRYLQDSEILKESLNNKYGERTNYIWFCPNLSTLKEGAAVSRFFGSWGGEAVYNGHEEDENIGPHLKAVGIPCIVKCSMPIVDVEDDLEGMAKRFIAQFISKDVDFSPDPSADFDMSIQRDLSATEVLEIIKFNDPRFEAMTDHANWYEDERL